MKVAIGTGNGGGAPSRSLPAPCATAATAGIFVLPARLAISPCCAFSASLDILRAAPVDPPFPFRRLVLFALERSRRARLRAAAPLAFAWAFAAFALIATWDNTLPFHACTCQDGTGSIPKTMSYSNRLSCTLSLCFIQLQFRNPADEIALTPEEPRGRVRAPRLLRRIHKD